MAAKRGLGRGLGAYFGDEAVESLENGRGTGKSGAARSDSRRRAHASTDTGETGGAAEGAQKELQEFLVNISLIDPRADQPRKDFDEESLAELAESVKRYGILQPLIVQKKNGRYEIVAGERRFRAAGLAGLSEVPVVIRQYDPQQTMEISLIENLQRSDLNPVEEALAYRRLLDEFSLTQAEIAGRVSKNRTTIANSLRLLNLPEQVLEMLAQNRISSGHARALLSVEDPEKLLALALQIEEKQMSVRETERAVKRLNSGDTKKEEPQEEQSAGQKPLDLIYAQLEERLRLKMGTKVSIRRKNEKKGKVEIEYYSAEELERIVELIETISD